MSNKLLLIILGVVAVVTLVLGGIYLFYSYPNLFSFGGNKVGVVNKSQGQKLAEAFLASISAGKAEEAVGQMTAMLSGELGPQNGWVKQLSIFQKFTVQDVSWINDNVYKVTVDVDFKPGITNTYGWSRGVNTRYLYMEKDLDIWKVGSFSLNP